MELGKFALWLLPACSNSSAGSEELRNGNHIVNKCDAFLSLVVYCPSRYWAALVDVIPVMPEITDAAGGVSGNKRISAASFEHFEQKTGRGGGGGERRLFPVRTQSGARRGLGVLSKSREQELLGGHPAEGGGAAPGL